MSGFDRKRSRGQDDYEQKKRYRLPPIVELSRSLCLDINTIGETGYGKYDEDVDFMSLPIASNFENETTFRDAVLNTLFAITLEQPQKIPHIGGLIQVVNTRKPTVGKIIVEFFHQKAQEILELVTDTSSKPESYETGSWNKLKLILRLLSTLSYIVKAESLVGLYKQFLNLAIDLQSQSESRNALSEALFYNTLLSVPFLSIYNPEFDQVLLKEIIDLAESYKPVSNAVTITSPFERSAPYEQKEIISLILPALKKQIESPLEIFFDFKGKLNTYLAEQEKHEIPQFSFPTIENLKEISGLDKGLGSVDGIWRTPRLTFEVYLPTAGFLTIPPTDSYFGLLVRDITIDIVEALEFNRKEVARQIITIDLFFKDGLFASPGSSIDTLREVHQKNIDEGSNLSTWKTEDIAVETVLSLVFKLPTVSQPSIYFYTVLVEACTNASQAIAPVMGRAIRYFYDSLANLDFELRLRYLDWLSVQLSNFNFTWKWREWENDSISFGSSHYHPKITFIRNLIAKELRLTNKQRISSSLSEEFIKYLDNHVFDEDEIKDYYKSIFPETQDLDFSNEESSILFFSKQDISFKSSVEQLAELIHTNKSQEDYITVIDSIKESINDFPNPDKFIISLLFQTVAFVGNRSISHSSRYFGTTAEVLKSLITNSSDENAESYAIEAVLTYWNKEPHYGFLVIDILEALGIVSSLSKISYILKDDRKGNLGLVNISGIESILRTLNSSLYGKKGYETLIYTFKKLVLILSNTLTELNTSESISIPLVDEDNNDTNELKWKYDIILGFIRTILRKYSDEFSNLDSELLTIITESITHEPTISRINGWTKELKYL